MGHAAFAGDLIHHKTVTDAVHRAAALAAERVASVADVPGPKFRIGQLSREPIESQQSDPSHAVVAVKVARFDRAWQTIASVVTGSGGVPLDR